MTNRQPPRPIRPTPPSRPVSTNANDDGVDDNKPYKLVTFPDTPPRNASPAGHDRYQKFLPFIQNYNPSNLVMIINWLWSIWEGAVQLPFKAVFPNQGIFYFICNF